MVERGIDWKRPERGRLRHDDSTTSHETQKMSSGVNERSGDHARSFYGWQKVGKGERERENFIATYIGSSFLQAVR